MPLKKINLLEVFLLIVILFCIVLIILQNFVMTGKVSEYSMPSNVSIAKAISISFSNNLSDGIVFGTIANLPAINQNASHNYDNGANGTSMYINISMDGNTNVDFCIKASNSLTDLAADVLAIGNETYANSTSTNVSLPSLALETPFSLSYAKAGNNLSKGTANYYRFWLDVPVAQPPGDYENIISFKGIEAGISC